MYKPHTRVDGWLCFHGYKHFKCMSAGYLEERCAFVERQS